jgi:hypothetical protein
VEETLTSVGTVTVAVKVLEQRLAAGYQEKPMEVVVENKN